MKKDRSVFFKWPGVAGIELKVEDSILIVDPYFTRAPFYKMWAGRIAPDRELTGKYIKNCDFVLVTHSHIDHLMDVPDVIRKHHCSVYG